ncbi:unnamed protein product [Mucor hiemalis]
MTTRRVLIGYDHSDISNNAMEWIIDKKVLHSDDEILVASIVNEDNAAYVEGTFGLESPVAGPAGWLSDDYRERISKVEKDCANALKQVVTWFDTKGFKVTPRILSGEPGETLKDFAEANKVDLVIVGSRGLGFIKRQFIGSVSDYLVHHLKCSVLVVKDEHHTADHKDSK